MNACRHLNLVLMAGEEARIRCRHCHLTIKPSELEQRWCPECYERTGRRRSDFDEVADDATVQYRCEDCGALITAG